MKNVHLKVMTIVLCLLLAISIIPKDAAAAVPSTPTGLTATMLNSNQISLSWNYTYDTAYYYVYRSTSHYGTYTLISSVTSPSYLDTNLDSNTTYYYKVQAYNVSGSSGESSIASAATSFVSGFTATSLGSDQIQLSWGAVSSASYYSIYRSTSYSGTYSHIAASSSTNYTDSNLSSGATYYYKYEAINSSGSIIYTSGITNATANSSSSSSSPIASGRLSGTNRYATSKAISESGWNNSYYAVVVSGENYPDALCSAPLAAKYNAPVLLTTKTGLDYQTRSELSRLEVKSVFLIGGVNVISSNTEQSIRNMGISVTRIAGTDRYDTSLKVAQALGYCTQAVIATGQNYSDALSIAPIAAMKRIPILLTPQNNLSYSLRQYLNNNINKTFVVGGTNAISTYVLNQLPSPERLSGTNRYKTNIEIIKRFANELNLGNSFVATGQSFPDALAGSALAALSNSPVFLVSYPLDYETTEFINNNRSSISKITAFGGTSVISSTLLNTVTDSTSGTTLTTPTGLTATNEGNNSIYLTWNSMSAATYYYVYRATSYYGDYSYVTSVSSPWYTDTGLVSNTTYYYKIKAYNSSGYSPYSSVVSATTTYGYPSTPTGLSASAQNLSQIYLSWNSAANASYYYIYRATSSGGSYSYVTSVSSTYYTDSGLSGNTTYYYKVLAYNSLGSSSYSSVVSATTSATGAPAAPTGFTASASGTAVNLSWNSVTGASSYELCRSTSESGTYTTVATTSNTSYSDTPSPADLYYYKVRAKNSSDVTGSFSEIKSATTVASVPAAPTGLSASALDATDTSFPITLTWTASTGATRYTVSRALAADGAYAELDTNVTATTYTDSDAGLAGNTPYYYKVRAENAAGASSYSTAANATTAPAAPANFSASAAGDDITLSWDAAAGAHHYNILRATTAGGPYTDYATTPATGFLDSGLAAGTYYYKVQAVNSSNKKSILSAEESADAS